MKMQREFYEVHVTTVDANGQIHVDGKLDGVTYPIVEDSVNRAHDLAYTLQRALDAAGKAENGMSLVQTRDIQYVYIIRGSDGKQINIRKFGELNGVDVPDIENQNN